MWVYIQSEPNLFTVGFYSPDGMWHADSDYPVQEWAANRVHWLNGGNPVESKKQALSTKG